MTGGDTQVFPETGRTDALRPDRGQAGETDLAETDVLRGGRAALGAGCEIRIPEPRGRLSDPGGRPSEPRSRFSEPTGLISDPWDESAPGAGAIAGAGDAAAATGPRTGAGATRAADDPAHDPHEVTVQLDSVQLGDVQLSPAASAARGRGQEGSDGPVFVDESGRRSRRFRRFGMLVGIACAVYAVVIVATLLSGSSDAPWLPVPGQDDDKPAGQVHNSPLPAESAARPSGSAGVAPGTAPRASDGTTPSRDARATEPAGAKSSAEPGRSADPEPTATRTTAGSGGGHGSSPTARPSSPAASTPATPSNPVEGSADPTESPVSGGTGTTGTGPVAAGPAARTPVAGESGGPATSLTHLSPERIL